jgi:hypothetical protein
MMPSERGSKIFKQSAMLPGVLGCQLGLWRAELSPTVASTAL